MNDKRTLLGHFLHWEQHSPQSVYLTQPHTQRGGDGSVTDLTWSQVGGEARRMAAYLQSLQLPPGSHIGLLGGNSAHWIIADLSIWMAGHVSVPLLPTLSGETARFILEHSEVKLLFLGKMDATSPAWKQLDVALPPDLQLIGLPMSPRADIPQWIDVVARQAPLNVIHEPKREELATIIYTSGSTGRPKGVMHSHGTMTAAAQATSQMIDLGPGDRMLSYLPLAHAAERSGVEAVSLCLGFRLFFIGDIESFPEDLKRARPTFFFSVPRLWTKFYLAVEQKIPGRWQKLLFAIPGVAGVFKKKLLRELGLDQVRYALTGSAPLPDHIIRWYRNLGLELLDVYAMTENFAVSHASRPGSVRIGYVGSPCPGVKARVSESGELEVQSPGQMLGYYKDPEQTAESMTPDGFFRTGDRGEIDDQQRLRITGRVKDLFKTGKGKYVVPVPIEGRLGQSPVVECVCVAGSGEPQPFALVMLSQAVRDEIDQGGPSRTQVTNQLIELLGRVNAELEHHEQLDYIVVVKDQWTIENGYLTPTLKIKRNVIEQSYAEHAEAWRRQGLKVIWQ